MASAASGVSSAAPAAPSLSISAAPAGTPEVATGDPLSNMFLQEHHFPPQEEDHDSAPFDHLMEYGSN